MHFKAAAQEKPKNARAILNLIIIFKVRRMEIIMKLFDGLKDFFMPSEEDDDYTENEGTETTEERKEERPSYQPEDPVEKRNKVVNIQATTQLQVVLVKPEKFSDARDVADHLLERKTVVLNLETATAENKRRIIDFLVGVAYANGGDLKPVANLTYIITPYNVGFVGEDIVGELENNGVVI